jgi:hypothetical protein
MAVSMIVKRTDDFGRPGEATTVRFTIEGVNYAIDLNKQNKQVFLNRLGVYVRAARVEDASVDPREVRKWAAENGIEVNQMGRVPSEVLDAYRAEMGL